MNKQDIKKKIETKQLWNEITVSVGLPLDNPELTAEVVCSHFEEGDWVITRCWVPEIYRGSKVGSVLLEEAQATLAEMCGFEKLLVQPCGHYQDIAKERAFFKANGFKETSYAPRLLEWRQSGLRIRVVPAAEILGHPTLSLLADDHI
jgi:hypothetical protein